MKQIKQTRFRNGNQIPRSSRK